VVQRHIGDRVLRYAGEGTAQVVAGLRDAAPSGLGWLPDGRLLVVGMKTRAVYRQDAAGDLVVHADLAGIARGMTNDMIVAADGTAYVGDTGLPNFRQPGERQTGQIFAIAVDGQARSVADDLALPNGMILSPDGETLIVAESAAHRLTAFRVRPNGTLTDRRKFAELPPPASGAEPVHPDGICLDAEGAVWVADINNRELIRVKEGGRTLTSISCDPLIPIACVLGGPDRRTLYICMSEHTDIFRLGTVPVSQVMSVGVDVPGAGLP